MIETWRQQMSLGVVFPMAYPNLPTEADLLAAVTEVCLDDFFDVLEIPPADVVVLQKIKAIADQAAVKLLIAGQPPLLGAKLSLNDPVAAQRQAAIDNVKASIDAAYEVGSPLVAVLSGLDPGPAERDNQLELLSHSLTECCRYAQAKAKDYVVWITLETFDHNIDKRCLIGPSTLARQLAEHVRAHVDNFGLTLDLSHLPLLGESPSEALEQVIDYLIHAHAGNCALQDPAHEAYGDLHPRFGMAGTEIDVPQLKEYLEGLVYAGYFKNETPTGKPVLTFEVKPLPSETSQLILAGTKRTFLRAWAEL
jgi:sugar phosphate isomerase/epimerase